MCLKSKCTGPVFVISDLHLGDRGARDNFCVFNREQELGHFLDHVERRRGKLIIAGDLLDFWQANISKVIVTWLPLLKRLNEMEAVYVLGNHDSDLNHFLGRQLIDVPLINNARREYSFTMGGRTFQVIHGHEADPYCSSEDPGTGRITAILTALSEDRHGGPRLGTSSTVESRVLGPMERAVSLWGRLCGKPDRYKAMNRKLRELRHTEVLISGHTHKAGRIDGWYYNTGSWSEFVNSYVEVRLDGSVCLFDWVGRLNRNNYTELPV